MSLPNQIDAFIFRSSVVGGDPDHVVGIDSKKVLTGNVSTGYVKEHGCIQLETLIKPKQIEQAELAGCEFGYTQSGDYGAWLGGKPYNYNETYQEWGWGKEANLYWSAVYWNVPFEVAK